MGREDFDGRCTCRVYWGTVQVRGTSVRGLWGFSEH